MGTLLNMRFYKSDFCLLVLTFFNIPGTVRGEDVKQQCEHFKQQLDAVEPILAELKTNMTSAQEELATARAENLVDHYTAGAPGTLQATAIFTASTGTFTAPTKGYYTLCAFFRFLKGGNAVDVTIRVSGTRVAAFGDAVGYDWRSTGVCTVQKLAAAATAIVHIESGGGSDCVEETGWSYARFNGYLIAVDP